MAGWKEMGHWKPGGYFHPKKYYSASCAVSGNFFSPDITRIPLPLVTLGLDAQSLTSLTITQLLWDRLLATLFPLGPDSNLRNIFSVYKSFTLEQLPSYSKLEANSTLIIIITSSAYILMEAYSQALFKN